MVRYADMHGLCRSRRAHKAVGTVQSPGTGRFYPPCGLCGCSGGVRDGDSGARARSWAIGQGPDRCDSGFDGTSTHPQHEELPTNADTKQQVFLATEGLFVVALYVVKASVLSTIERVLGPDQKIQRLICWIMQGVAGLCGVASLIVVLVSCEGSAMLTRERNNKCPAQVSHPSCRMKAKCNADRDRPLAGSPSPSWTPSLNWELSDFSASAFRRCRCKSV